MYKEIPKKEHEALREFYISAVKEELFDISVNGFDEVGIAPSKKLSDGLTSLTDWAIRQLDTCIDLAKYISDSTEMTPKREGVLYGQAVYLLWLDTFGTDDLELIATKTYKDVKNSVWIRLDGLLYTPHFSRGLRYLRDCGLLKIILPELDNCSGVEQNAKYHQYDVFEHSIRAAEACKKNGGDLYLVFATLIHDIGKPFTKAEGSKGITFHKHEVVGRKLAAKITKRFKNDWKFIPPHIFSRF